MNLRLILSRNWVYLTRFAFFLFSGKCFPNVFAEDSKFMDKTIFLGQSWFLRDESGWVDRFGGFLHSFHFFSLLTFPSPLLHSPPKGGIASGKSTVASIFREASFAIIDADQIAREIVEPGECVCARLRLFTCFGLFVLNFVCMSLSF